MSRELFTYREQPEHPYTGFQYSQAVRDAAQQAAMAELQERLAPYIGQVVTCWTRYSMEREVKLVLDRYEDILRGYWWAVFDNPSIVYLVESLEGDFANDLALRSRFHEVGQPVYLTFF